MREKARFLLAIGLVGFILYLGLSVLVNFVNARSTETRSFIQSSQFPASRGVARGIRGIVKEEEGGIGSFDSSGAVIFEDKCIFKDFVYKNSKMVVKAERAVFHFSAEKKKARAKIKIEKCWLSDNLGGEVRKSVRYGKKIWLNLVLSQPIGSLRWTIFSPDGEKMQEKDVDFPKSASVGIFFRVYSNNPLRRVLDKMGLSGLIGAPPSGRYKILVSINSQEIEKEFEIY